jgi:hypothetical protein
VDTFFRSTEKTATSTKSFKPSQSSIRPAFDGYNESDQIFTSVEPETRREASQSSMRPAFDGYNESDQIFTSVEPETRREGSPTHDSSSQDLSQIFSALDDEGHDLSIFDDENFFDMSSGGSPKRQRPDQLDMNLIFNRTVHFIFKYICIFDFRVKCILLHCFRLPRI